MLAPSDARHPLQLLQLADDAMYAAKRRGKNCVTHCAAVPIEGDALTLEQGSQARSTTRSANSTG